MAVLSEERYYINALYNESSYNHSFINFSSSNNVEFNNESYTDLPDDMETWIREIACQTRDDYITRMVIFTLFISIGIIGNLALLFIILNDRHLRNTPNVLISNLAFADLAYILVAGPIRIEHELHPCWLSSDTACALRNYAPVVCQCACVYSLVALSRERYSAIVKGIHSRNPRQMKVTFCWSLLTWVIGLLFAAPLLSVSHVDFYTCKSMAHGSRGAQIYEVAKLLLLYLVPLSIVTLHYTFMANTLIQSTHNFRENNSSTFARQRRARKRLAYMSIAISIFFGVFWLPGTIFMMIYNFKSTEQLDNMGQSIHHFRLVQYFMSLANPCFNPWLVFVLSTSHRRRLFRYLRCESAPNRLTSFHSFRDSMTSRMNMGSSRRRTDSGKSDHSESDSMRNEYSRGLRGRKIRLGQRKCNGNTRQICDESEAGLNSTTYV